MFASWTDVMPKELASAIARTIAALTSASDGGGACRATKIAAVSRNVPIGSFVVGSRSMRPPGGSGVAAVTSAMANAREFAQPEWPSAAMKNAGRSGTTASS